MSGVVKTVVGWAIMLAGIFTFNLALAKVGFYLANIGLLEEASKLFAPKPPKISIRQDIEYSGTVTPRRIIYGKLRVGGLNTIRPLVADSKGELLHQVLTIAGHPCNSILDVYFNQDTVGTRTAITGTGNDGKVTSGKYKDLAWVRCYTGSQTSVDYYLNAIAPSFWTTNHIGYDLTYAALSFKLDQNVYGSGKPDVAFLVEGKKCYDPRLDTSPGANPTSASYKAFTTNPALQLADYLTDTTLGRGIAPSKVDWTLVVAAANECDELVSIPGSTTQKRYESHVVLEAASDRHEDNIAALAGAMMGVCYRQGGKYRMYAGAALTPAFTLTEADIVGTVSVRLETPTGEKYNFVRGTFVDSSRNYQEVEFEPRGSAAYESADGRRIPKTFNFPTCTDAYQAQRNAIILRRRSRMRKTMTAQFALSAYKIRPFIVGTMTFADIGWSAQRVVCTSWKFVGDGTIQLTLQEDSSTIWDDPNPASDYSTPGAGTSGTQTTYTPDPPDNLTATSLQGAIAFSWDMPLAVLAGDVIELWEHTSSTPFASATKIWEGSASSVIIPKADQTTRYYWIRARAANTNTSTTEPTTTGVSGVALPPPADGAPGADGADGAPGADGSPGLTAFITLPSYGIQCDAGGVAVSGAFTNAVGSFTVYSGSTNVTSSCTFSSTTSNVTGAIRTATDTPTTGAKGTYYITALSAESGYLEMTATYNSQSIVQRFTVYKVRAGAASASAMDETISDINSTSYVDIGGTLTIATGSNGTLRCSAYIDYDTNPSTVTGNQVGTIKIQYRESGGSWSDFPSSETTGSAAFYVPDDLSWTSGSASITEKTTTGPTTPKVYEFKLQGKISTGTETLNVWQGSFYCSWTP